MTYEKAEIFYPRENRASSIDNLKQMRKFHTMCLNMLCGGRGSAALRSCEKFDGTSAFRSLGVRLAEERYGHLCWGLPSGEVLLLGGRSRTSRQTTERVSADGSSSSLDFRLEYRIL